MAEIMVVGVDLGGTHVGAAVMTHEGKIRGRAERDINREDPAEDLLRRDVAETVRAAVASAGASLDQIDAIGMGLPGNIDRENGICRYSPNFHWRDVPVAAPLRDALHTPVFLLNDVRSHTLGELYFGAGQGSSSFAMLALGTGLGGGVVIDGRLRLGTHSAAGELGHVTVLPDGPECGCGNHGCVEALVAAPGIARAARDAAARGAAPALIRLAGSVEAITSLTLHQAALEGDEAAIALWDQIGRWLGLAITAVVATVDPDKILIGGKVAKAGEFLLGPARDEVGRRFRMVPPGTVEIVPAALGDDSGVVGAGALALESLGTTNRPLVRP